MLLPTLRIDRVRPWASPLLALAMLALAAPPAAADWLLLSDGSEVETAGAWQTRDGLVTFELAGRRGLSSLRLSEVDLAASTELTRARAEARRTPVVASPAAPPVRRPPVLVLTDKDVRKVERKPVETAPAAVAAAEPPAAGEEVVPRGAALGSGLEVSSWSHRVDPQSGAVLVEGELRNTGRERAVGIVLRVELTAPDGTLAAMSKALLSAATLAPRQRSRFRAELPAVEFADVSFDLRL